MLSRYSRAMRRSSSFGSAASEDAHPVLLLLLPLLLLRWQVLFAVKLRDCSRTRNVCTCHSRVPHAPSLPILFRMICIFPATPHFFIHSFFPTEINESHGEPNLQKLEGRV